jgi:hypothetical protein
MSLKLLDEVCRTMRRRHYSIRTEKIYCSWVKRYVLFHKMSTRDDLGDGESKIEAFLSHLALELHVVPSTQNQAMNACRRSQVQGPGLPFFRASSLPRGMRSLFLWGQRKAKNRSILASSAPAP